MVRRQQAPVMSVRQDHVAGWVQRLVRWYARAVAPILPWRCILTQLDARELTGK